MTDETLLREKAREALEAGRIPARSPQRTWGGPGAGASCAICGKRVGPGDVEFELEFGVLEEQARERSYHVHVRCFAAWEFERHRFQTQRDGGVSSETPRLPPTSPGVDGVGNSS